MARPCTEAQTAKAQSISLRPNDRRRARQGLSYFLRRIFLDPERVSRSFPLCPGVLAFSARTRRQVINVLASESYRHSNTGDDSGWPRFNGSRIKNALEIRLHQVTTTKLRLIGQ